MSGGHGAIEGSNKKIALLVAVLAAFLAISETGGKNAQTEVLTQHVEATNMWTFFQAKTVRQTVVRTAAEELDAQYKDAANMAVKAQIEQWRKTAQRYDTEPETNEGRKELMARAKMHEAKREEARAAYHLFEYGSAAFQLAIVLAGASALTAVAWLAFISGGLGLVGAAFTFLGFFAPTLVHL
jgi:ABC-type multidrug transport system fused ATPase/permease subunit